MKLGIRAHDIPIYNDLEKLAERLHDLNFSYVQFAPRVSLNELTNSGENVSFGLANNVQNIFKKENIQIAVLGCYVNIIHSDLIERKKNCNLFKNYLSLASSFGSAIVATETGSVNLDFEFTEKNFSNDVIDMAIEQVIDLVRIAEKQGCLIGIEPGVNHPIHDILTTKKLLDRARSFNLKIILDPVNLILKKDDSECQILKDAINEFGEQIYAIHIKDYIFEDGRKKIVPIGEGVSPIKKILEVIDDFQVDPYVLLDEIPQSKFQESLDTVIDIANSINDKK